jgi:anaerobic magnesium-protoporphyrin IX monomethyl ester cyclase
MDLLLAHGFFLEEDPQEQRVLRPYAPLGLLYLSSHLKQRGFDVRVFDATFRSFAEFRDLLQRDRPPVVGLACNLMTKRNVLRMAAEARRLGSAVVVGGPDPPAHAEEYLGHGVDVVVIGEGEATLEELLPKLLARPAVRDLAAVAGLAYLDAGGHVVRTPPRALLRDLDAQPWPDRDAVDLAPYLAAWRSRHGFGSLSVITARGCPYTCRWCSRSVFGETHRRRSPAGVADEVQHVVETYRPERLWYADDVFTIHAGWLHQYAAEMERRGLRVPFECISRAERVTEAVADDLVRLGCYRLWIGSESGSHRVLEAMDRRMTPEHVHEATRRLQARGIEVGLFVMLGYPGEEHVDLRATVDHLKRARADVFLTTVAYPIKGTPFHADVASEIATRGAWADTTDRDLRLRGRPHDLYYRCARTWMEGEVARDRHWREGRVLRAARAATLAGAGRVGMALLAGVRERP